MFRKIVSNLSFSPAIVGQLGFYAKRLRKEEATRRLGLIFVALALVVQSLAVFQPPESANAASSNDFIYGGLGLGANRSLNKFLGPYDSNERNLKDIMSFVGITRQEIASAQFSSWITKETFSWGHNGPYFSYGQGERKVSVTDTKGNSLTHVYARPLKLFHGSNTKIYGWIGHSEKIGWFAIMQSCGNLVTNSVPQPPTPAPTPAPTPVPTPTPTPVPTPVPIEKITLSKEAVNISQGLVSASQVTANASDQIKYTISSKNEGNITKRITLEDNLSDVLEYSTLIDDGGGTLNQTTKVLSWPDVDLAAGKSVIRTFAVRLLDTIPATARGASEPISYDCTITNAFGNSISISVTCPTPKIIEQVATELPKTGPTENILFAGIVLAVVAYFYARTRQVKKEVRLLRRNLSVGTI